MYYLVAKRAMGCEEISVSCIMNVEHNINFIMQEMEISAKLTIPLKPDDLLTKRYIYNKKLSVVATRKDYSNITASTSFISPRCNALFVENS